MRRIIPDVEIDDFLREEKHLPDDWRQQLHPKIMIHSRHLGSQLTLDGAAGNKYIIETRQSPDNCLDYSIILVFREIGDAGEEYVLLRCNGIHRARHSNKIEQRQGAPGAVFDPCPHIHMATERYQMTEWDMDAYAQPTDLYRTFPEALEYFTRHYGFRRPSADTGDLFAHQETRP